jgi:Protein of unknown function (DUF3618)
MTYSEQLELETESCREQLTDTLDELRMRMTPGEVVDQLIDYARDTTGGKFFENLKQQVASNPLPVALMGASLAWLMSGKGVSAFRLRRNAASWTERGRGWASQSADAAARGRQATSAAVTAGGERMRAGAAAASETVSQVTETMGDASAGIKDATARMADAASAAGAAFGDSLSETYDRAAAGTGRAASAIAGSASRLGTSAAAGSRDIMEFCREQPLVLAGLGLAVGAVIGAMLPRTQTEDRLMGDASEELKQQTRGFAGEQLDKAKKVAERGYDATKQEAERQGLTGEAIANDAAASVEDTSIAPSSETQPRSEQASEERLEPLHERH